MVLQERPPGLRGRFPIADQILAHGGLADIDAQLKEFAMNARRTQSEFSRLRVRIKARTSFDTAGRPG